MNSTQRITALALASAMSALAIGANAAVINKGSGPTTPDLSDFGAAFASHPNKVGYNHTGLNGMFVETFKTSCEKGQGVSKAIFTIKVRKLAQGKGAGDNDALAFWDSGAIKFNTYLWTASDPAGTVKTLSFDLSSLPSGGGVINTPAGGNGMGVFSDGDFSFSVQDDTAVMEATLDYGCGGGGSDKKGLTWGLYPADAVTGTATVSCQGAPGPDCNPYNGDTSGNTILPVLCFRALGLPYPAANVGTSSDASYWSGGAVATTAPVSPIAQGWLGAGKAVVDAYCVAQFGPGWEVAEHHMGQNKGWKFGAFGNVGKPGTQRFWMHIKNQPNGNVW